MLSILILIENLPLFLIIVIEVVCPVELNQLLGMGFDRSVAESARVATDGNVELAMDGGYDRTKSL